MISKWYKTIFVHIHKTAGTSIEQKLGLFTELHRGAQDHRKIRDYEHLAYNVHTRKLKIEQYESFFKFTFVRNSWSRIYSWYANVMRDENHKAQFNIPNNCTLSDFILTLNHEEFNQLDFLTDSNGKLPLDFIGRFERLHDDFAYVCQKIEFEDHQLPKILVSGNEHYTKFYDKESIDLVHKYYKKEIDHFNFEFGE